MPGVQNPHWAAWCSWKRCCSGLREPSGSQSPAAVVTARAVDLRGEHDARARRARRPRAPCRRRRRPSPQPYFGSVTSATSRSQRNRERCPPVVRVVGAPFTVEGHRHVGRAHAATPRATASVSARTASTRARCATVLGGRADVADGLEPLERTDPLGQLGCVRPLHRDLDGAEAHRTVADAPETEPRLHDPPVGDADQRRRGTQREVAATARHLREAPAPPRAEHGHTDTLDEFVLGERGGEVALVELGGGDAAVRRSVGQFVSGAGDDHREWQFRRGIGVCEGSAERAARADPRRTDPPRRGSATSGCPDGDRRVVLEVAVRRERADRQVAVVPLDAARVLDVAHVDQRLQVEHAEVHHRQQALPAGQDLGAPRGLAQHRGGVGERLRSLVAERLHEHARPPCCVHG